MRVRCVAALLVLFPMLASAQASPVGRWLTTDEQTGEPRSIVVISERNGELTGTLEQLLRKPDAEQSPLCVLCQGARRNKPIVGMNILWGVSRNGDEWEGGKILDPKTGKEYSVKLRVLDGGNKLQVRGYLGVSLLGRTHVWERQD